MDLPGAGPAVLAQPTRARVFSLLVGHKTPLSTDRMAQRLGLHPNGVRRHLELLSEAGLVERRQSKGQRGRPGDLWSVAPDAHPGGERPTGYADLARWLARALPSGKRALREIEQTGREVGRELTPPEVADPVESFRAALAALGFAPVLETTDSGCRCRLENCPFRDSVRENPELICGLHRGITLGLLAKLDPRAELTHFEPHDPDRAGCIIDVAGLGSA